MQATWCSRQRAAGGRWMATLHRWGRQAATSCSGEIGGPQRASGRSMIVQLMQLCFTYNAQCIPSCTNILRTHLPSQFAPLWFTDCTYHWQPHT